MYINEPMKKYLDDTASGEPTPGGGSVAALVGALGAALTSMVCNFTVGKEKYKDVEAEVTEILSQAENLRGDLAELMQADTEAYSQVSAAYGMPRKSSKEKEARTAAIQEALKAALQVPLKAAMRCYDVLKLNEPLVEKGNSNLISDVGVAVALAESALQSAALNVEINLVSIKDEEFCKGVRETLDPIVAEGTKIKAEVWEKVMKVITG
ncbi:cyclodeaminase/cyclohydrolase family protein [Candidatus Poribacteria bacterium]|nr:cyclodeaminase/cyclohydrolase family protein [Candidatus Poribacteria bacterium]